MATTDSEDAEGKKAIGNEDTRLIEKLSEDFSKHVEKGNLSEILLKGHLLIEHYLDHTLIILLDKEAKVHQKSFYEKVSELKEKNCFYAHSTAIATLYALNKIRNEMAHQLDFEINLSQIDAIGYTLGRDYILKRYEKDIDEKKLLLWVLDKVITMTYYPIWVAVKNK